MPLDDEKSRHSNFPRQELAFVLLIGVFSWLEGGWVNILIKNLNIERNKVNTKGGPNKHYLELSFQILG